MEDALVRNLRVYAGKWSVKVLILVLMEDALVHCFDIPVNEISDCLNPCFNGRCTRTSCHNTLRCSI